jgi:FkbM family methyltransferase
MNNKVLVNIMCCFVPLKRWRKRIRHHLISLRERRRELLDYGCTIDADILTSPTGVKLDVSKTLDNPLHLIIEVFVRSEYNLNITKESVLIDIGMNRAVASLLFATNENIKRIYAYEPFKPTFELAKKNLLLNSQLSKKIIPLNFGLGKTESKLELPYSANASVGMSTIYRVCENQNNTQKETVYIKDAAKEIDSILKENEKEYLIVKCDCEGAEFEIFERLSEKGIISKIDVVMMEYHFETPDRLIKILTENCFAVQVKSGYDKSDTGYIYAVRMEKKHQ